MKQIYTTTLRLNLTDEDDCRAFEHLQRMDKRQYRSYSKAIVAAVNGYFERQERIADDPYLETREKEDAFLRRIMETIEQGLRYAPVGMLPPTPLIVQPEPSVEDDDNISAALDFADCRAANSNSQRLRSRVKIKYPFVRHVSESVL